MLLRVLPLRAAITLEFLVFHHRFPHLDRPQTFNEKVARRKLFDRDPRMPILADKILAKQEVVRLLGKEWVIPTLWSGNRLPPRSERNWPIPYVLKASHGSGWNIFVLKEADQDWDAIDAQTSQWLKDVYGKHAREWLYTQITPGLLVEPFLGIGTEAPPDYKLWVFGGRTAFIQVDLGRLENHRQLFYDLQWKRQKFEFVCPWTDEEVPAPRSLAQMVAAANLLGAEFTFVRVDLYEIDGKPFFGELTFGPTGGRFEFKPKSIELEMGRLWPEEPTSLAVDGPVLTGS